MWVLRLENVSNGIERLPFIFLRNKNHTKLFLDNEEKWTGKKKTNWFTQSLLGSQKLRVPVGESEQDLKTCSFLFFDWCRPSSNSHLKAYQLVFSHDKVGTLVMMSDEVIALYLSTYGRFSVSDLLYFSYWDILVLTLLINGNVGQKTSNCAELSYKNCIKTTEPTEMFFSKK